MQAPQQLRLFDALSGTRPVCREGLGRLEEAWQRPARILTDSDEKLFKVWKPCGDRGPATPSTEGPGTPSGFEGPDGHESAGESPRTPPLSPLWCQSGFRPPPGLEPPSPPPCPPPPGWPPPGSSTRPSARPSARSSMAGYPGQFEPLSAAGPASRPPGTWTAPRPSVRDLPVEFKSKAREQCSPCLTTESDNLILEDPTLAAVLRVSDVPSSRGGAAVTKVEWCISQVEAKLRTNCGFPLVSPAFDAPGFRGLRLLFLAGEVWSKRNLRSNRKKHQPRRSASTQEGHGPAFGGVRLKAGDSLQPDPSKQVRITVGDVRHEPITVMFGERTVQGVDLTHDWSEQVRSSSQKGALCITAEFW